MAKKPFLRDVEVAGISTTSFGSTSIAPLDPSPPRRSRPRSTTLIWMPVQSSRWCSPMQRRVCSPARR
jgi:hypothetical protein